MSISAAVAGLKTAVDLGKSILDLRDQAFIQKTVIELNNVILSVQDSALSGQKEQLQLLEENASLKKRVAELEGKEDGRSRYHRTDMGGGTFAYTLKDGPADHALCANCFEQGHSSTLQMRGTSARGQKMARCPSCKETFGFGEPRQPTVMQGSALTRSRSQFRG